MGGEAPGASKDDEALDDSPADRATGLVQPKGHVPPGVAKFLLVLAAVPIVLAFSRVLALPGWEGLPLGILRAVGEFLNDQLTLDWVPPNDRHTILYLLILPTGALLVAFARLTLGLRVLGLRAILISIGFRASGFLPSLGLMLVVVGTVLVIRPWLRRARLPLYARITVILCVAAITMLGALLIAPALRSDAVWGVAFFPVIIMAMLAEAVAKTLEQDSAVTAIWRFVCTVLLACVIAVVSGAVDGFLYEFPELLLTELLAIVFIAEYFHLRLLEEWPARLNRLFSGDHPWYPKRPRIAVVVNRKESEVIGHLGRPAPARYRKRSVQRLVDALRDEGFLVRVCEGDRSLLRELNRFLPPDVGSGGPGGIVLNLATGVQGAARFCQVPALLEMTGIAYTGPDPLALARLSDRFTLLTLLREADVDVPRHALIADPADTVALDFPLAVRPRLVPDAPRTEVADRHALRVAVGRIRRRYGQDAIAEEILPGRGICVALLGNAVVECLPLVERTGAPGVRACPAPLDEEQAEIVRDRARRAYRAAGCRDYARVDMRLGPDGVPRVVNVQWADLFLARGSFLQAVEAAGHTLPALMRRIVEESAGRYMAAERERRAKRERGDSSVVSLAERRAAAK